MENCSIAWEKSDDGMNPCLLYVRIKGNTKLLMASQLALSFPAVARHADRGNTRKFSYELYGDRSASSSLH